VSLPARVQRMLDGEGSASPAWNKLGIQIVAAEAGRVTCEMAISKDMRNHQGVCHGGFIATLADSAMGATLATVLPERERHMSFDLKLTFIRPVRLGATLRAVGKVVHAGRRTGVGECELSVGDDLVATASASFIIYLPENNS
jgi:uncharacterized protein (TIGR00369 family)